MIFGALYHDFGYVVPFTLANQYRSHINHGVNRIDDRSAATARQRFDTRRLIDESPAGIDGRNMCIYAIAFIEVSIHGAVFLIFAHTFSGRMCNQSLLFNDIHQIFIVFPEQGSRLFDCLRCIYKDTHTGFVSISIWPDIVFIVFDDFLRTCGDKVHTQQRFCVLHFRLFQFVFSDFSQLINDISKYDLVLDSPFVCLVEGF